MRKIKAKPPTLPKNPIPPTVIMLDAATYYTIRQRRVEEYEKTMAATAWADGLKTFQKRFGVIES